jgi:hypothetical protein
MSIFVFTPAPFLFLFAPCARPEHAAGVELTKKAVLASAPSRRGLVSPPPPPPPSDHKDVAVDVSPGGWYMKSLVFLGWSVAIGPTEEDIEVVVVGAGIPVVNYQLQLR